MLWTPFSLHLWDTVVISSDAEYVEQCDFHTVSFINQEDGHVTELLSGLAGKMNGKKQHVEKIAFYRSLDFIGFCIGA